MWLHLLAASALLRFLPEGWVRKVVNLWRLGSIVTLLVLAIPFMVQQVRCGIYPQLKLPGVGARFAGTVFTDTEVQRQEGMVRSAKSAVIGGHALSDFVSADKDVMFAHTDTKQCPWFVVNADVKRHARLNCIAHLLSNIPYNDLTPGPIDLPPRTISDGYVRPPLCEQTFVPEVY